MFAWKKLGPGQRQSGFTLCVPVRTVAWLKPLLQEENCHGGILPEFGSEAIACLTRALVSQ